MIEKDNQITRQAEETVKNSPTRLLEVLQQQQLSPEAMQHIAFLGLKNPAENETPAAFARRLRDTVNYLKEITGIQAAYNLVSRLEVAHGTRKPSMAIYDHTFHIIGGGEKYGFTVAHALQEIFDITILVNKEITHQNILDWYHLDLAKCKIKILPIPFFDQFDSIHLDPGRVTKRTGNPFHIMSIESGNYDFFINNGMNEMIYPLSNISSIICHFPERRPASYFYADKYTYIIYNSKYTAGWIEKKWKFSPHQHLYPPVDMEPAVSPSTGKENIILSVARFETGGSKKQLEMVRTFNKLSRQVPGKVKNWKLYLVGGSPEDNPYLEKVRQAVAGNPAIEIKTNIPKDELKALYGKAKIFWHLCGLDQSDPALVEHFGMTIVESMQNRIAPIVFDGGGQREIVEQGKSGFRVTTTAQLIKYTLQLMEDQSLWAEVSENAYERSKRFTRERFEAETKEFFTGVLKTYIQG